MTSANLDDKFFNVLSAVLTVPRDQLDRCSSRESVAQWDSLKHMHLMLALEEEFGVEFDDHEISGLTEGGALLDAIISKGGL